MNSNVGILTLTVNFLQNDKEVVHEFVNSDGLSALISVGQDADQFYQIYVLRGNQTIKR